ncbi:uncharacterized protein LOC123676012 isoform X3 [Harmonia axyridis]|uniref:uncharacterized protein LOC123676012 isoform X3 n=1 Tax=Harmonia axyridis TaxID=115357 RepID=UPI001E277F16|nr:uncharacterized protein LOC123676012 isoform X3 [Harmonia axyridis]
MFVGEDEFSGTLCKFSKTSVLKYVVNEVLITGSYEKKAGRRKNKSKIESIKADFSGLNSSVPTVLKFTMNFKFLFVFALFLGLFALSSAYPNPEPAPGPEPAPEPRRRLKWKLKTGSRPKPKLKWKHVKDAFDVADTVANIAAVVNEWNAANNNE